jgi:UDP-GlcNAc:undecaprenyl-phosphate/decaprenyl-phosphate GlcNAc-1-phosphate transferase
VTRLLRHENPFLGGRDHLSHRLVRLGIPIRTAVGSIYVAAASLGVVGFVISRIDRTSAYLLASLVFALGLLAAVVLGRVPLTDDGTRVSRLVVPQQQEKAVASLAARRRATG